MMKKLEHPAIPLVVDIVEDETYIFIVRDYVEGDTLKFIVEREGAQDAEKVIDWGKQLCEVLQYLHSLNPPHIYRDMKPANIVLRTDGSLKLIDFGIMRLYDPRKRGDTCVLGTRGYVAPEQYGGMGQTDARTDIFGLGMTLHHLVTGVNPIEPPYEVKPIREVNPELPIGLEYIISKCIEPNPDNRYQSCDELYHDLCNYENLIGPSKRESVFAKIFRKR